MSQGVGVVGLYVRDQDEAVEFYVEKLGFRVKTDVKNGDYRWLTVQHPEQPSFELGLFKPGTPTSVTAGASVPSAPPAPPCPSDLDGDGQVGAGDLAVMIGDWGCAGACPGDVDGDGDADSADLATLLGSWGACP